VLSLILEHISVVAVIDMCFKLYQGLFSKFIIFLLYNAAFLYCCSKFKFINYLVLMVGLRFKLKLLMVKLLQSLFCLILI
jgi:hypothetical protein